MNTDKLQEARKKSTLDKKWMFDGLIRSFREMIHLGKFEDAITDGNIYLLKETNQNSYQPVSKTVYDYFVSNKDKYSGYIEP